MNWLNMFGVSDKDIDRYKLQIKAFMSEFNELKMKVDKIYDCMQKREKEREEKREEENGRK